MWCYCVLGLFDDCTGEGLRYGFELGARGFEYQILFCNRSNLEILGGDPNSSHCRFTLLMPSSHRFDWFTTKTFPFDSQGSSGTVKSEYSSAIGGSSSRLNVVLKSCYFSMGLHSALCDI